MVKSLVNDVDHFSIWGTKISGKGRVNKLKTPLPGLQGIHFYLQLQSPSQKVRTVNYVPAHFSYLFYLTSNKIPFVFKALNRIIQHTWDPFYCTTDY